MPSLCWSLLLIPLALLSWRWPGRPFGLLAKAALFFVGGALWVTLQAGLILADELAPELEGQDVQLTGCIASLPQVFERGSSFEFAVFSAERAGSAVKLPRKIKLSSYQPDWPVPQLGDEWRFTVRLKRPHGFQNPGSTDYEATLFHQQLRATGYIREQPPAQLLAADPSSYPIGRFRQYLSQAIARALPGNPYSGMITAFANGDQSAISDLQWEVLRRTGTTHLIAISGMNIGLIAGIVFFLSRWLWALPGFTVLRLPAQQFAAICALLAAIAYAALAGFALPAQRAMIMLTVLMAALLAKRNTRPSQLLAVALLAVLIYDPLAVLNVGFWLSFAAVGVIVLAMHGRIGERSYQQWGRLQWVVAVGLLPLTLLLFQQSSLSGPAANMLAIPLVEIAVIPLTLLGVVALLVLPHSLAALFFQAAAWVMDKLWWVLEYLAGLEQTLWTQAAPLPWTVACAALGVVLLLAPRGWPGRWLGIIWLAPLLLVKPVQPAPGALWVTLLDVGQGLATVVRTEKHTLVFDTGPRFSAAFDTGRAVVVPYLRNSGVERLDLLIISHADNDHIGGAQSLLKDYPAQQVLSSVPERLPSAQNCSAGQDWEWDGIKFAMLNPLNAAQQDNNASCVLLISGPQGAILLSGDIEASTEQQLVARWGSQLRARLLVVPHHGSKTSSTQAFIDAVDPDYALFPYGYRNRYRHPNAQVVARYVQHGTQLLNSSEQGAISVKMDKKGMEISSYRQSHDRYWLTR